MFTALGSQMPFRQFRCKGTKKIVHAQEKRIFTMQYY